MVLSTKEASYIIVLGIVISVLPISSTIGRCKDKIHSPKVNRAEKLEIQEMETRKKVLGQEHPDTLTSMDNLVEIYRKQG